MMRISMTYPQLRRREVSVDDELIHLTPMETDVVMVMLLRPPGYLVSKAELTEVLWPDPEAQPITAIRVIYMMIMRLRRKGVPIESRMNWGYAIPAAARGDPPMLLAA